MSDPFPLPGPNPYVVETISVGVTRDVRIGHEHAWGEPDEVWLSAEQFLALLEWGNTPAIRERIEYMVKERQQIEQRERQRVERRQS